MRQRLYLAAEILIPVALLLGWWFASATSNHPFWPPLADIWTAFREKWTLAGIQTEVLPSLMRMSGGFFLATFLGIA
ncbi:MAG TPA: hypothetical protein VHH13_02000, partial [Arthrobacter sp.]|nr:hypothetical protein [Arthrobacter sp.]